MIDFSEARLTTLAVHKVGNKVRDEGVIAAESLFELDDVMMEALQEHFLTAFKSEEFFKFEHEEGLEAHELNSFCRNIFTQSRDAFLEQSKLILMHLYGVSVHPHIKSGDVFIAHFRECEIDGQPLEAIGIFKTENKDTFLKSQVSAAEVKLSLEEGTPLKRIDKGCLVFNTFQDDGYSILMVDRSSEDTHFWREDFLQVSRIQDQSYQTQSFLHMTKEFCEEVLAPEHDRKEQVVFLNRSLNYFAQNPELNMEEFKREALETPSQREAFEDYRQSYAESLGDGGFEDGFPISKYAVRRMKREFKSLISLDTNIEIRLNTRNVQEAADYMEKGFDQQRGMHYYKVFFWEEE
ncbi:MAG: nucleoid-associated protein [Bacteroidota bacterium]